MKKLLILLSVAALALPSTAGENDYLLYWLVSDDYVTDNMGGVTFQGAELYANVSGAETQISLGSYFSSSESGLSDLSEVPVQIADLASLASSEILSFYIEFQTYNGGVWNTIGKSETMTIGYAQALSAITDYRSGKTPSNYSQALSPSSFYVVPEPTSGLMLLVGLASLALKRRRQSEA